MKDKSGINKAIVSIYSLYAKEGPKYLTCISLPNSQQQQNL